jgi:hypothetical protein
MLSYYHSKYSGLFIPAGYYLTMTDGNDFGSNPFRSREKENRNRAPALLHRFGQRAMKKEFA